MRHSQQLPRILVARLAAIDDLRQSDGRDGFTRIYQGRHPAQDCFRPGEFQQRQRRRGGMHRVVVGRRVGFRVPPEAADLFLRTYEIRILQGQERADQAPGEAASGDDRRQARQADEPERPRQRRPWFGRNFPPSLGYEQGFSSAENIRPFPTGASPSRYSCPDIRLDRLRSSMPQSL